MESPIGPLKRWQMSPKVQKTRGFAMIRYLEISHTELDYFSCISSNWPEVNFESPAQLKVHLISFTFTKSKKKSILKLLCSFIGYVIEIDFRDHGFDCLLLSRPTYSNMTCHRLFHVVSFPFPCRFGTAVFCSSKVLSGNLRRCYT